MKMINNYLDSFESYLPEQTRAEIREEFESSILDQIEDNESQLKRPLTVDEQKAFLLKLGHPMKVAAGYLTDQQLIGGDYYPAYKRVLNVAFWVFAALTILRMLPFKFGLLDGSFITTPIVIFWAIVETGIWVFAYVTLIFYLLEKYQANINFLYAWSPAQLSSSGKKLPLSRVETAFEVLFIGIFLSWWNGLFSQESIFIQFDLVDAIAMSDSMIAMQWPVNIIAGLAIAVSLYNLVNAGWKRHSLVINILIGIADLVIIAMMFQFDQYVSFESSTEVGRAFSEFSSNIDLNIRIVLAVIASFVLWDIYSSYRKI